MTEAQIYNYRGTWTSKDQSGKLELKLPFPPNSEDEKISIDTTISFLFGDEPVKMPLIGEYDPKWKDLKMSGTYSLQGWFFDTRSEIKFSSKIKLFDNIEGEFESEDLGNGTFEIMFQPTIEDGEQLSEEDKKEEIDGNFDEIRDAVAAITELYYGALCISKDWHYKTTIMTENFIKSLEDVVFPKKKEPEKEEPQESNDYLPALVEPEESDEPAESDVETIESSDDEDISPLEEQDKDTEVEDDAPILREVDSDNDNDNDNDIDNFNDNDNDNDIDSDSDNAMMDIDTDSDESCEEEGCIKKRKYKKKDAGTSIEEVD